MGDIHCFVPYIPSLYLFLSDSYPLVGLEQIRADFTLARGL